MSGHRDVVFARINRRRQGQLTFDLQPFEDDVRVLAASRTTTYREPAQPGKPTRTWFAADMKVAGGFLIGTLGYSEKQEHRQFDDQAWSWVKGETRPADTGTEQTVVPFAVDLGEHERWVAFATTHRMRAANCATGLQHVLREAVTRQGILSAEWDVDLVTSPASVREWLREHPEVRMLRRTIKFTNPGLDLDDDRAEMRALGANRKTEEYAAPYNRTLDLSDEQLDRKLEGVDTGDVTITIESRGQGDAKRFRFVSAKVPDRGAIDEFGGDLELGMELVLGALRRYARRNAEGDGESAGGQPRLI